MQDLEKYIALDKEYCMNTFGNRIPLYFTHGNGCVLYDQNGKPYLDLLAGIAVNSLGYNHPGFTKTMQDQIEMVLHYSNYFYNPAQENLASLLCQNSCADKVFFANSGAEANECALKLARKYFYAKGTPKHHVISTVNSFHGRTLATVAATGQEKYRKPFEPLPSSFTFVPFGEIAAIESAITAETCAVIIECIQGEGGVIPASAEYLHSLRSVCDKHGLLLIFDEVQTGMGRTGKLFAHEHYGVDPDIFTTAKALGNGFPISATLCKNFCAAFEPGDHGTTFGGNVLACNAGLFVTTSILSQGFLEEVESKGAMLKNELAKVSAKVPLVREIRGIGLMVGIELSSAVTAGEIQKKLLERGYIVGTAGFNTLRIVPPLIISREELAAFTSELELLLSGGCHA